MATDFITIAILAKNKAHVLPYYLQLIEQQTYPADKIKLYIRTNNNTDQTANILEEWLGQVEHRYSEVFYDPNDLTEPVHNYDPHDWNAMRLEVIGRLRQGSVDWAKEKGTHYFTVDCDNFIIPETLSSLYQTNLPVVAPFLKNADDPYSPYANYHYIVDKNGYYQDCNLYYDVFAQKVKGLIDVAVVHCTYFIRHDILDYMNYVDGSQRFEYVILSETLRKAGIPQYLDNRKVYGKITFSDTPEQLANTDVRV